MEKSLFNRLRIHPAVTLRRAGRRRAASLGAAMLLCALAAVSCSKEIIDEQPGGPASGEIRTVPVTLKTGLYGQIDVKSVDGIDENAIKNVWVVQLSEDGSRQLAAPQYVSSVQKAGDGCRFDAELALQPSQVICLANTGNSELLPATGNTLASVSALAYSVTDEASLLPDGVSVPSFALWTGTPSMLGIPMLELKRATAKLNLNVTARLTEGFTFQLKSIKICNVPKKVYYLGIADRTSPFPGIADGKTDVFATAEVNQTLQAETPVAYTCLLPANRRGTGTGTKPSEKDAANAPQDQADYCTYVELAGEYLAPEGNEYHSDCNFKIYLGENLTDNYNLLDGHQYNLSVAITGASTTDARLTVTESYGMANIPTGSRWALNEKEEASTDDEKLFGCLYGVIYDLTVFKNASELELTHQREGTYRLAGWCAHETMEITSEVEYKIIVDASGSLHPISENEDVQMLGDFHMSWPNNLGYRDLGCRHMDIYPGITSQNMKLIHSAINTFIKENGNPLTSTLYGALQVKNMARSFTQCDFKVNLRTGIGKTPEWFKQYETQCQGEVMFYVPKGRFKPIYRK